MRQCSLYWAYDQADNDLFATCNPTGAADVFVNTVVVSQLLDLSPEPMTLIENSVGPLEPNDRGTTMFWPPVWATLEVNCAAPRNGYGFSIMDGLTRVTCIGYLRKCRYLMPERHEGICVERNLK